MTFSNFQRKELLKIVWDAAVANHDLGDGRLLPLLILDSSARPDFAEFIQMHKSSGPQDMVVRWGQPLFGHRTVVLSITTTRPTAIDISIEFEVKKHMGLVDAIIHSNGVYLIAGKSGDTTQSTMMKERVLFEIPDTGFLIQWNKIVVKCLTKGFVKKGMTRSTANEAALNHLKSVRELWKFRMNK